MRHSLASSRLPWLHRDVLDHIFEHGPLDRTLSNAALVCRYWTAPAQAALYHDVSFFPLDNRPRDLLLARTMRTCPHLRRYVRRLSLITLWTHSPTPELCDWISHLPAHCLREFHWTWIRGHILPSIISSPAIRTTTRIRLCGRLYTADKLQPILDLPCLESLSLELTGHEVGDIQPLGVTRLRHLHVYLLVEYGPVVDRLLSAVGPLLESLQVSRKLCFDSNKDQELVCAIETHCRGLTHLTISAPFKTDCSLPVVDRLAHRFRSLKHLCCSEGTYTANLFDALLPNLVTLELSLDGPTFSLESSLLEYLNLVRLGQRRLTTLVVTTKDIGCFKSISDACCTAGIIFREGVDDYRAG
ncbi:hypothetical protein L227DRAFT_579389 [Lentinus tigrinus ALCF2SS1-6]|uniref:Uncharacterized protein n=1 Tax=Lentinus tigrinus ALCF2SS1-6 TaxID=1328759 RepID=A0A5C2RXX0_9APHY|nr:hypothetical protein L227DRAFT_579389 [Lentinus tigrinus ALCF2SS1-6]